MHVSIKSEPNAAPVLKLLAGTTTTSELRNQHAAFCVLTLLVLALLLVLHTLFASVLGQPSIWLILLLAVGFSQKVAELIWLFVAQSPFTRRTAEILAGASIIAMFALTALLAYLTNRDESPYFVLLAIPILQSAHLFSLTTTILTTLMADGTIFFWVWHFYRMHPPPRATEYLEAGMISIIYLLMGGLVWFLVNQLKLKQFRLSAAVEDLQATRERLVTEEKLAAVGRLAAGIAHEVRNPVTMISSSLATAAQPSTPEPDRQEMFAMAAREAARLEHLTADFLTYARPAPPRRHEVCIRDLLTYVSDLARMHTANRSIEITVEGGHDLTANVDSSLIEGALLNLILNAADALPDEGSIQLRGTRADHLILIDIQNSGPAIPAADLEHIFEPFFTTKPAGTGLGLAIARGVAKAHDGDLWVSSNINGRVIFTLALGNEQGEHSAEGTTDG